MNSIETNQIARSQRQPQKGLRRFRYGNAQEELADASTSVRRWWWEYLRLSKDYWLVSKTSGSASPRTTDQKLAAVFKAFGNVHDCTFEEWWHKRGSHLFQEQKEPPKVIEIDHDLGNLSHYRDGKLLLEIPLKLSRSTIQRSVSKILKLYEDQRPKNKLEISESNWPINPVRYRLHTLQQMHEVYCLHRELISKPIAMGQFRSSDKLQDNSSRADLFRLGKLLSISPSNESLFGDDSDVRKRQNRMRATVSRFFSRAELLIGNVELGAFPVFKPVRSVENCYSEKQKRRHLELDEEWWSLDLTSTLSSKKVEDAKRMHYSEPFKGRS